MPLLRLPQVVEEAAEAPPSNPPTPVMEMPVPVKVVQLPAPPPDPALPRRCRHRQRRW